MSVFRPFSDQFNSFISIITFTMNYFPPFTHFILCCGVSRSKYGDHSPADISPVVLGEIFSDNTVTEIKSPNVSQMRRAVVVPIMPAPIIATFIIKVTLQFEVRSSMQLHYLCQWKIWLIMSIRFIYRSK